MSTQDEDGSTAYPIWFNDTTFTSIHEALESEKDLKQDQIQCQRCSAWVHNTKASIDRHHNTKACKNARLAST